MRKALINDLVHSFCYAIRHEGERYEQWPTVMLQQRVPELGATISSLSPSSLVPFVSYAYAHQPNYVIANRSIVLLASWLRTLDSNELHYAHFLMERYYDTRIGAWQASSNQADQSQLRGDGEERVLSFAEMEKRNELLDAFGATQLPEEVSANQEPSS